MTYIAPGPTAADFDLGVGAHYIAPGPTAADFDLAAYGDPPIVYPPIPGLIAMVGLPWIRPATRDTLQAAAFGEARSKDIERQFAANQASRILDPQVALLHEQAQRRDLGVASPWEAPDPRERALSAPSTQAPPKDIEQMGMPWQNAGVLLDPSVESRFIVKTPWKDIVARETWRSSAVYAPVWKREENIPAPLALVQQGIAHIVLDRQLRPYLPGHISLGARFENNPIQPKDGHFVAPHGDAAKKDLNHHIPWGPAGRRDTTLEFEYPDYSGPIGPGDGELGGFLIPTLRIYIVTNSASIVRVSDGRDVPALAVSMAITADAYSWDLSATLAGKSALALVEGTDGEPVEVDVTINGEAWRVLIDGWRLTEAWRNNGGVVRGRSRAAYLAAPYAPVRDYAESSELLAQQLAAQELPFGWELEWGLQDWIVTAGAWKYQGLAPIDAIARIAQAGGGYVQADKTADKVIIKPKYPAAPWLWTSTEPDYMIPRDIIIQRSSDKKPGQGVNGVYVHGADPGGILAKVRRTGTAGDVLTSTIVDSLITDAVPARHRGVAALAETARQATETHELPLSAAYGGLIEPGALVVIGEEVLGEFEGQFRGLVRGVSVQARASRARNGGVALSVRQFIDIERHFEE